MVDPWQNCGRAVLAESGSRTVSLEKVTQLSTTLTVKGYLLKRVQFLCKILREILLTESQVSFGSPILNKKKNEIELRFKESL